VDHGVCSLPLEEMGDASPWLNPRCVVNFASDRGFAPKMYRQENTNLPTR
jgi:hypothetical protein